MISANGVLSVDQNSWQHEEKVWYNKILLHCSVRNQSSVNIGGRARCWKLRGNEKEIENWIKNQNKYILCFDGASKNNPGRARASGVIYDQKGEVISSYDGGLGL